MRALAVVALLAAGGALAQGARIAVHPLELREMTPAQRERVQAHFDVMLARISEIRLAGSTAVEDALLKPEGKGCETRDPCLRFFAEATESLYALYARLRPDPLGAELVVTSRIVRSDGASIRSVTLSAPIQDGVELTETARLLLARLLEELSLKSLSPTMTVGPVATAVWAQPAVETGYAPSSPRRPVGFALLGIGAVTLAGGAVVAGIATHGRSRLTVDAHGAVPANQAARALEVAREGQAATVLIPVGAVFAVVGGVLAFWRTDPPVVVGVSAGPNHAGVELGGSFP